VVILSQPQAHNITTTVQQTTRWLKGFSLRTKVVTAVIISLLISAPIADFINNQVLFRYLNIDLGVYVGTAINLLITTTIISIMIHILILNPLWQLSQVARQIASGDLDVTVAKRANDEIGAFADDISLMRDKLQSMIQELQQSAGKLDEDSEALRRSLRSVEHKNQKITETMLELAKGSQEQAQSTTNIANHLNTLSERMEAVNADGEQLRFAYANVLEMANNGQVLMDDSVQHMQDIDQLLRSAVEQVEGLSTNTNKITQIVKVIEDIAAQTNMLALNASIEAARAGASGQGFAVVAEKVRQLAEQVSSSIQNITEIVTGIQSESSDVTQRLRHVYERVEAGTSQIRKTGENFSKIQGSVSDMTERIQNVSRYFEELTETLTTINKSLDKVASVSEEFSASVDETTRSVEQQNNTLEKVGHDTANLSNLAENLRQQMQKFKI
jgi:methyl-accepting chemotaxis protein